MSHTVVCEEPSGRIGMSAGTTTRYVERYQLAHKKLIDEELWERLVTRLMKDGDMERSLAERVMDQTLGFLRLGAAGPGGHYSPSPMVDKGWHVFILYTRHYAAVCEELGGFVHHEPSDVPGMDYDSGNVARTVMALRRRGFAVDEELWMLDSPARSVFRRAIERIKEGFSTSSDCYNCEACER